MKSTTPARADRVNRSPGRAVEPRAPHAGRRHRSAAPRLSRAVQYAQDPARLPTRPQLRKWAKAALRGNADVTLRLVSRQEGRALNAGYRGKRYATNVLTFVYPDTQPLSGDIVLCTPVVAEEARQQRKTEQAHYAHLVVHGMLHLQGYDHENDADAAVMEALESEIVTRLGYPDPYKSKDAG
jgi:probable rRNA maturation factor